MTGARGHDANLHDHSVWYTERKDVATKLGMTYGIPLCSPAHMLGGGNRRLSRTFVEYIHIVGVRLKTKYSPYLEGNAVASPVPTAVRGSGAGHLCWATS
jgi:hypothetical protein